jgi:putative transposase
MVSNVGEPVAEGVGVAGGGDAGRGELLGDGFEADDLMRLAADLCAEHEWRIVACEVMPDQVHLFVKAHPRDAPSFIANQFKGFTSRRLRDEFPHLRTRLPTLWSRSYFTASVGAVSAATVQRYIDTQYERPWRKERDR